LARADVYVANQLFATLDPTTRRVELPGGHRALFTDTVGFIQKLPTALVAAFRATLEEITEADLLIHVVDITHANAQEQAEAVHQTLHDIGAAHIPVLTVLNKIDRLDDPNKAQGSLGSFPNALAVSALEDIGIKNLLNVVTERLFDTFIEMSVYLPYQQGNLIALFHEQGQVARTENKRGGVEIQGKLPGRLFARFQPYVKQESETGWENDTIS